MGAVNNHSKIKSVLFAILLVGMLLPMIQQATGLFNLKPLKGSFKKKEAPSLTLNKWLDGSFQRDFTDFTDQNIGFKSSFVRVYNQLYFSAFNHARTKKVVIGKQNYLYEKGYIKAALGLDFVGEEVIRERVRKLVKLREILAQKDINIIPVIAPGKATFFNEYYPAPYDTMVGTTTNYEVYKRHFDRHHFNWIDFHDLFLKWKDTHSHPLFPKTGIHWSKYGEVLAADSLIRHLNATCNYTLDTLEIKQLEPSQTLKFSDDDIEQAMNLLFNIEDLQMVYPSYTIKQNTDPSATKILTIGDSYYWGMFNSSLSKHTFGRGQFWYYCKKIYPDSYQSPLLVKDIDIVKEVEKNQAVLLLFTEANLHNFGYGFIEQLYDAYHLKEQ